MSQDGSSDEPARSSAAARVGGDLLPRLASGIALAALALGATLAGALPFVAMVALVGVVVAWEWGRIVRGHEADIAMAAHIAAVAAGVVLVTMGVPGIALLAIVIGMILTALLSFGRQSLLSAAGVAYAALPAVALIWLRADEPDGIKIVLFLMLVVATTDTAAYFAGWLIGGPKLWPRISPKKTWAGLAGGVVASALAGAAFAASLGLAAPYRLAMLAAIFAIIAQAGDFAESALKRKFGAKDASALIPGHGGFMDRVDGLIAVAVAAAVIAALLDVHAPAHALLRW